MTGARRAEQPFLRWRSRPPQGYARGGVIDNREPVQTPTVILDRRDEPDTGAHRAGGITQPEADAPALTEVITEGQQQAERGETADLGSFAQYAREPVPDLDSADPADRTEWFRAKGGSEQLFDAAVADLDAGYLLDTSLPVPVRTAPETTEDTTDSGSGSAPPVDEAAETTPASADPEPVSSKDEPAAEQDCGEGGDAA